MKTRKMKDILDSFYEERIQDEFRKTREEIYNANIFIHKERIRTLRSKVAEWVRDSHMLQNNLMDFEADTIEYDYSYDKMVKLKDRVANAIWVSDILGVDLKIDFETGTVHE